MISIDLCSETEFLKIKGEGVSTSFDSCKKLLLESDELNVSINGEFKCDIMHSHTYGPYFFLRGLRYKGKKIFTAHVIPESSVGTFPFYRLLMPLIKLYLKTVYNYADVCIAISPTVERSIRKLAPNATIVSINNPVLKDFWARTTEKRLKGQALLNLKKGEKCILGVGQLETRKGCVDFIEIAKQLPHMQFRWIGGRPFGKFTDGYMDINKAIKSAPKNVQFLGIFNLEEMPYLYAGADIFIFPSYQENSPLAPLEAAASGIPVVYRDLMEYNTLYKNEYLKADSNDQFVSLINLLLNDPVSYNYSLTISTELLGQFDKDSVKRQLIELYSTLHFGNQTIFSA
jgi:1,2-diacylglycerol-3-alpha-glucose alpha-1,2-galactosyltransferase